MLFSMVGECHRFELLQFIEAENVVKLPHSRAWYAEHLAECAKKLGYAPTDAGKLDRLLEQLAVSDARLPEAHRLGWHELFIHSTGLTRRRLIKDASVFWNKTEAQPAPQPVVEATPSRHPFFFPFRSSIVVKVRKTRDLDVWALLEVDKGNPCCVLERRCTLCETGDEAVVDLLVRQTKSLDEVILHFVQLPGVESIYPRSHVEYGMPLALVSV